MRTDQRGCDNTYKKSEGWMSLQQRAPSVFLPTEAMQGLFMSHDLFPTPTQRRNNADKHNSKLVLLMDEVVQRLESLLQPLLADLETVLRHVIGANLDESIHSRTTRSERSRAFPSCLQCLFEGGYFRIHLFALVKNVQRM